jgi:hypothetical protein
MDPSILAGCRFYSTMMMAQIPDCSVTKKDFTLAIGTWHPGLYTFCSGYRIMYSNTVFFIPALKNTVLEYCILYSSLFQNNIEYYVRILFKYLRIFKNILIWGVQQPNLGDFSGRKANQCLQKAKKGGKHWIFFKRSSLYRWPNRIFFQ